MMFFDWKIQSEKVQLTRDLKDETIIYQGIRLPCKMSKVIAILPHEHKQPSFGSLKTHLPHFKLQELTQERINFIKKVSMNEFLFRKYRLQFYPL